MQRNNKKSYIVLSLLLVVCLSIGYSILNSTLTITGKTSISKNTWNVYFENIKVTHGSVEAKKAPTIENDTMVDFEVELNLPGDFYEFTVDVINSGTIDAIINSVEKTPDLTDDQKKYINYIIEYQNGEPIDQKQLVKSTKFVRFKVRIEYKKDLTASDLPQTLQVLNLGFNATYVQSDGTGRSVVDNGVIKVVNVVSGDGTKIGDEVCIKDECFYVISSTDDTVTMLAKYNLYIGGEYNSSLIAYGDEATGKQDPNMLGYVSGQNVRKGVMMFSNTNYWSSTVSSFPAYVYDLNSELYSYVENYKIYLSNLGLTPREVRLISHEELTTLGCSASSCKSAPQWVYSSTYWTGSAFSASNIWNVVSNGFINYSRDYFTDNYCGCRPVITISKKEIII